MKEIVSLLKLTRTQLRTYGIALLALTVGTVTVLFVPPLFGRVLNAFPSLAEGNNELTVRHSLLLIAGLISLDALATITYSFLVAIASERIINELRARFFRNLLGQPLDERSPKHLGQIASEFASDLGLVQDGFSGTLLNFLRHSMFMIGSVCALLYIDPKLTLVAFAGVGLFGGLIVYFIKRANKAILSVQQYRAKVMSLLLEGAFNAYIVQAYGRTDYLSKRFDKWLDEMFRRVRSFLLVTSCISPVSLVLFSLVMTGVAFYGIRELRMDSITVQQLVTYFSYALVLIMSASQVGYLGGRLRQASLMFAKHQALLVCANGPDTAAKTINPAARVVSVGPHGFIVQNVTFCYPDKQLPALTNVSFTIEPGRINAIIGESGAGKSTIAALLCGVYRPQSGLLRLTAESGSAIDAAPGDFRQAIALVPQEPFLFAASITENIAFGREGISEAQVRQAAMAARIHDFIMTLPEGYRTVIQEGGKDLSRGQRQRISIARALAGSPSIMILDEATASLDAISERAIKAAIEDLRGRVTFVVIAHQGALLSDVDHLVALQLGEVLFEGHPNQIDTNSSVRVLSTAFQGVVANTLC